MSAFYGLPTFKRDRRPRPKQRNGARKTRRKHYACMETGKIRRHPQGRASPQAPNASICLSSVICFRASSKACSVPPPAGQAAKLFSAIPSHLLNTVELRTAIGSRERGKRHLYSYIDVNTVPQGSSSDIVRLHVLTCSSSAAHASPPLSRPYLAERTAGACPARRPLLNFHGRSGIGELLPDVLRLFLGDTLFYRFRSAIDQVFSLLQAQAGHLAYSLDHVDFIGSHLF